MVELNQVNPSDILVLRFGGALMGSDVDFQYEVKSKSDEVLTAELVCPQPCSTYWYVNDRRVPALAHQKKIAGTLSIDAAMLAERLIEHIPSAPEESVEQEMPAQSIEPTMDAESSDNSETVKVSEASNEVSNSDITISEAAPSANDDEVADVDTSKSSEGALPVEAESDGSKTILISTTPYTEQQKGAIASLKKSVSSTVRLAEFLASKCNMIPRGLDVAKLAQIMESRGIDIDQLVYGDEKLSVTESTKAA